MGERKGKEEERREGLLTTYSMVASISKVPCFPLTQMIFHYFLWLSPIQPERTTLSVCLYVLGSHCCSSGLSYGIVLIMLKWN